VAFIKYISYEEASDDLKSLYDRYGGRNKTPANIIRVSGVTPPTLEGHIQLYRGVMGRSSSLSARQREMVATVVSAINNCHY